MGKAKKSWLALTVGLLSASCGADINSEDGAHGQRGPLAYGGAAAIHGAVGGAASAGGMISGGRSPNAMGGSQNEAGAPGAGNATASRGLLGAGTGADLGGMANTAGALNTGGTGYLLATGGTGNGVVSDAGGSGNTAGTKAGGTSNGGSISEVGGGANSITGEAGNAPGASGMNTGGTASTSGGGSDLGGADNPTDIAGSGNFGGTSSAGGTSELSGGSPAMGGGSTDRGGTMGEGGCAQQHTGGNPAGPAGGMGAGEHGDCLPAGRLHQRACWPMPNTKHSGLPHPANYPDLGNGTVRDNVTRLAWERTPSCPAQDHVSAAAHCQSLLLGGHGDWRVPSWIELASVTEYARCPSSESPTSPDANSGEKGANPKKVCRILTRDAMSDDGLSSPASDRIRCVRSGQFDEATDRAVENAGESYVVSCDEAKHRHTHLVWQRKSELRGFKNWHEAAQSCADLGLGGHQTWRLPSLRELATLVDQRYRGPNLDPNVFSETNAGSEVGHWYWARPASQEEISCSWGWDFDGDGPRFRPDSMDENVPIRGYLKCVRDE